MSFGVSQQGLGIQEAGFGQKGGLGGAGGGGGGVASTLVDRCLALQGQLEYLDQDGKTNLKFHRFNTLAWSYRTQLGRPLGHYIFFPYWV